MSEVRKSDGQLAYEAYGEFVSWTTVGGTTMPSWEDQRPELCDAWRAAGAAVRARADEELY